MVLLVFFKNQITHSDDLKKIHFIICMAMDYFHNQFCWYVDLMTQMCMCFKKSIISFTKYKTKQNLLLIYLLIDKFFLIDYCDLILNLFLSFENLISNKKLLEENSWISLNIWKKTVKGIFGFVFFLHSAKYRYIENLYFFVSLSYSLNQWFENFVVVFCDFYFIFFL